MNGRGRALEPGTPRFIRDDEQQQLTAEVRSVTEVRRDLITLGISAMKTGAPVDPNRLDDLAQELHYAAMRAVALGRVGEAIADEKYAQLTEETAELCRLIRSRNKVAA